MNKLIFLIPLMVSLVLPLTAQSSLEAVLDAVENNNLLLSTERQFWDAEKNRVRIGLTLPNPTVEGEYLIGSPETAGNQIDISALQAFELPVAYKRQRELAAARAGLSVSEVATRRQEVLLETKLTCLELTYFFQLNLQYDRRRKKLAAIQEDFRRKLETGEGNILDVNKVGLQLLELRQRKQANDLQIQQLGIRLTELNGGQPIAYRDSLYPPLPDILEFTQIEQASKITAPQMQTLKQRGAIAEKQLEVSKLYRLPSFEAGYRYQSILGQRFNGIHLGVKLPLWEQKYRTETRQAQVLLADLELARFANEHYNEIKELYDRQAMLNQSLEEYRQAIRLVDNGRLLDKALRLGEITTVEYFLETSLYENARLHALQLEYEYQAAIAELTKSSLL
jgi:outer membrane protein TolC